MNRSSNNNNSNLHHPPPSTRQQRQARMDRLLELYDRALLLLEFSRPFLPQAIEVLENTKHRDNHINFGGSTVGIVSGILGVAAAATIVTPAGVPLLIVSLLLGGAATGAQTGTEVHSKFFSEPKQLANRIMALHGMALSILNLVRVLRDVVTQDHVQLNAWQGEEEPEVYGLTTNASSDSLHSPSGSNNNSNNNNKQGKRELEEESKAEIRDIFLDSLKKYVRDEDIEEQKAEVEGLRFQNNGGTVVGGEEMLQLRKELLENQEERLDRLYEEHHYFRLASRAFGRSSSTASNQPPIAN
mmetsp:Transcript_21704/g.60290  ORF Transcript_21704/g.60290 Transcript_21704/m.60290 type:complete len:300 (-) Transcript_21704:33-932(-)